VIYRAVLDPSAVAAYAAGSVHVGELLTEFADEKITFAVPVACLIDAMTAGADVRMLDLLLEHPWAQTVYLDNDWSRIGAAASLVGGHGRAVSVLLQLAGQAGYVATCDPDVYGEGFKTIPIED
jgi:hypothetical protein